MNRIYVGQRQRTFEMRLRRTRQSCTGFRLHQLVFCIHLDQYYKYNINADHFFAFSPFHYSNQLFHSYQLQIPYLPIKYFCHLHHVPPSLIRRSMQVRIESLQFVQIIINCLPQAMNNKPISSPSINRAPNINKFNYHSRPASTLSELLSSDFHIKSFQISEHGRTGVFFIETRQGSFVMKSSNDGPKDQFLNRFAAMLSLSVPQSICYCCSEPIFHKIMFQIERYCERDEMLYERIKTKLDYPFYQVLEYIPSISLAEIGRQRFEAHLLDQNKLYTMGMCLGFDIIINNSDRFKLLWSSNGNINNVLVQIQDHDIHEIQWIKNRSNTNVRLGNYVFIDHAGFLLDLKNPLAAKNFDSYMLRVSEFLVKMIRAISEEKPMPEEFEKLKKDIEFFSHYTLTQFDLRTISHGIIYIIKKFLELFQSKAIEELYNNLKKGEIKNPKTNERESSYWFNYWNTELSKVNIFFLQEVYTKIAAIFTTYPETIQKILEHVGDIDELVGNNNFNDLNDILDVKGTTPEKSQRNNDPPTKLDILTSQNTLQQPSKVDIQTRKEEPAHQDTIRQQQPQRQQSQIPSNEVNKGDYQPELRQKLRKWRQKLAKFKETPNEGKS